MNFADSLDGYVKRTKLAVDDAVVAINSELTSNVIMKTPVKSGRARANWTATIGDEASGTTDKVDKGGQTTIAKGMGIAKNSSGKVFYLTNNLAYINRLEYGYSGQAPSGMVRITLEEIKSSLRKFNAK